jgi:hypothetical protein
MALAILSLVSCHPGAMDELFSPRPDGPFRYDCSPRPEDPEGYVVRVCEYLNERQIWVGRNGALQVAEITEMEMEGRDVIVIRFACCGTGDSAAIDKETGEVIGYSLGVY